MLAVDFFKVDCAITLKRIYVSCALEVGSRYARSPPHSTLSWPAPASTR
jgi:hypothetical protein